MSFFKQLVVLSAILLGLNIDAMEREVDRTLYLHIEACNETYNNKFHDDYINQSDSNITIFEGSFSTYWEDSENAPRETIDTEYQTHREFNEYSQRESMAEDNIIHQQDRHIVSHEHKSQFYEEEQKNNSFYKPHTNFLKQLSEKLSSEEYRDNLVKTRSLLVEAWNQYTFGNTELKKQIQFIDGLLDGSINRLITKIQTSDLKTAKKAFAELKKTWPWQDSQYVCSVWGNSVYESKFIEFIGTDIMQVARNSLLLRKDYLESHGVSVSQITTFKFKMRDIQLQGYRKNLIAEREKLIEAFQRESCALFKLTIEAKIIILNNILSNPTTQIFNTIKNGNSDQAKKAIDTLATLLFIHFEQQGLKDFDEARLDMIKREGVDLFAEANKCFKSRLDYQEKIKVSFESSTLLEKYAENSGKHIVAEQSQNVSIFNARKDALKFVANNPTACREQSFVLTQKACDLLQTCGLDPELFIYCMGNEAQHQLYSEFALQLNEIAEMEPHESIQLLKDIILACAQAGTKCAQQNQIEHGFNLADLSWASLDCVKAVDKYDINSEKVIIDIAKGVAQGLKNAVLNNLHIVLNPVETLSNIGTTFCHLAYCFGKFLEPITIHDGETELTPELIAHVNAEWKENMQSVIDAAKEITLEGTTAFMVECIASPKITKLGFGTLSHYSKKPLANLAKSLKDTKDKIGDKTSKAFSPFRKMLTDTLSHLVEEESFAVTHDGTKIAISNELGEAAELHSAMDKHGELAKNIIQNNKRIKETSNVLRVNNMKEFFETDFGKLLKNISEKTNQRIQGQTVYKITQKIQHPMLKKGDLFYLDKRHLDHLEIFSSDSHIKGVLNLDGIINFNKTKRVLQEGRTI
jgi:filamentous hemagglutinin